MSTINTNAAIGIKYLPWTPSMTFILNGVQNIHIEIITNNDEISVISEYEVVKPELELEGGF